MVNDLNGGGPLPQLELVHCRLCLDLFESGLKLWGLGGHDFPIH
jgi:hypothetical protein